MSGGDGPLAPADGKGSKEARARGREGGREEEAGGPEREREQGESQHTATRWLTTRRGREGAEAERGREGVGRP